MLLDVLLTVASKEFPTAVRAHGGGVRFPGSTAGRQHRARWKKTGVYEVLDLNPTGGLFMRIDD